MQSIGHILFGKYYKNTEQNVYYPDRVVPTSVKF
jgi:hypothetical protein